MAKKRRGEPPDLSEHLRPVLHLPVRSLPFNEAWLQEAHKKWQALLALRIGITQGHLADWCDCAQASISNVLGDKPIVHWRSDYLERLSAALEVELPARAQYDIEGDWLGGRGDDAGLLKALDLLRWIRTRPPT